MCLGVCDSLGWLAGRNAENSSSEKKMKKSHGGEEEIGKIPYQQTQMEYYTYKEKQRGRERWRKKCWTIKAKQNWRGRKAIGAMAVAIYPSEINMKIDPKMPKIVTFGR